jgi:large subunit ribosomal protein L4
MPTIEVWNLKHEKVGTLELADEVFGQKKREDLIWEVVKSQMAKMRKGTASTKTRAEVSGTGAKPFRQKRTGRARQGTRRSPHHVGGGVAFGPKPRAYNRRTNKKVRRLALCSALSSQAEEKKLVVVKDFELAEIKTKYMAEVVKSFGFDQGLLVDNKDNAKLKMSVRNLPRFNYRSIDGLNLVDILRYQNLMISETSIKQLEEELKK